MVLYTSTPDYYDNYISHYGVKGMKWKHHKSSTTSNLSNAYKRLNGLSDEEYWKLVDSAKLVGKGGSGSKSSSSGTGKSGSSEKKETGSKSSSKNTDSKSKESINNETVQDKLNNLSKSVDADYINRLNKLLSNNNSQLDKIRKNSKKIESRSKH